MNDPETMSYNHAWGGIILFPEREWSRWVTIGSFIMTLNAFIAI